MSTVCVLVTQKQFSTNDHRVDILEIHCTFRAHYCRVEQKNTPQNPEIDFLLTPSVGLCSGERDWTQTVGANTSTLFMRQTVLDAHFA